MRKRFYTIVLAVSLVAALMTGCGKQTKVAENTKIDTEMTTEEVTTEGKSSEDEAKTSGEKKTEDVEAAEEKTSESKTTEQKTSNKKNDTKKSSESKKAESKTTESKSVAASTSQTTTTSSSASTSSSQAASNKPSTSNTSTTEKPQTTECQHNWVELTKTVHHDAVYKTVVVKQAVYANYLCYDCGTYCVDIFAHEKQTGCSSNWTSCSGYVLEPEVTEQQKVSDAYDEEVGTGVYECSKCHARR